jgi:muramoyltetrapeptide carboxypeptidase
MAMRRSETVAFARQEAIRPRALGAGARVALVAPAGPLTDERLKLSEQRCRQLGLEPVFFPAAAERHGYLAGRDEKRLADLQHAFDDRTIDAVWALRGGYGTMRILQQLDLSAQRRQPKPFIGFSDNTAIHALHAHLGIVSFHAPHPGGDFPLETEESFRRVLFNPVAAGLLPTREQDPHPKRLRAGSVEGPLIGGNLAMLAALCGTPASISARDCILFLEDVGEPAYRVDRMLVQLKQAGVLEGVLGLALGRFSGHNEGDPQEEDEMINDLMLEFAESLQVPAVMDLPIGHVEHNWTMPIGSSALLEADHAALFLTEPAVQSS